MSKVYIIIGEAPDYDYTPTWINSVYTNELKANEALNDLNDFLRSLPKNPDDGKGRIPWKEFNAWRENCGKLLKKKDPKSSFEKFGVKYHLETIEVTE